MAHLTRCVRSPTAGDFVWGLSAGLALGRQHQEAKQPLWQGFSKAFDQQPQLAGWMESVWACTRYRQRPSCVTQVQ